MELATCKGRELALGRSGVGVGIKVSLCIGGWITIGSETGLKGAELTTGTTWGGVRHETASVLGSMGDGSFANMPAV